MIFRSTKNPHERLTRIAKVEALEVINFLVLILFVATFSFLQIKERLEIIGIFLNYSSKLHAQLYL